MDKNDPKAELALHLLAREHLWAQLTIPGEKPEGGPWERWDVCVLCVGAKDRQGAEHPITISPCPGTPHVRGDRRVGFRKAINAWGVVAHQPILDVWKEYHGGE